MSTKPDKPNLKSLTLPGLTPGIWAIRITAVDSTSGAESEPQEMLLDVQQDGTTKQGPSI